MSISLAGELNYLDEKDEELELIMAKRIKEGDYSVRDSRRRGYNHKRKVYV